LTLSVHRDATLMLLTGRHHQRECNPPATIPQTHQMHYAHAINAHVLEVSDISPFLGSVAKFTEARIFETETESENQPKPEQMPPDPDATKSPEDDLSFNVTIGCYVVVEYDSIYYPGVVEEVCRKQYLVSVLERCRGGWQWPRQRDAIWYSRIIKTQSSPRPVNSREDYMFLMRLFNVTYYNNAVSDS